MGLDPGAAKDDIRRAFHALARQYHPDLNNDPDAGMKFRDVVSAYDSLIQDKTILDIFRRRGDIKAFTPQRDIRIGATATLEEAFLGLPMPVVYKRMVVCQKCQGDALLCSACDAHGYVIETMSILIKLPERSPHPYVTTITGKGHSTFNQDGNGIVDGDLTVMVSYPSSDIQNKVSITPGGDVMKTISVPVEDMLIDKDFKFKLFPSSQEIPVKLDHSKKAGSTYVIKNEGMHYGASILLQVFYTFPENMEEEDRRKVAEILCRCRSQK